MFSENSDGGSNCSGIDISVLKQYDEIFLPCKKLPTENIFLLDRYYDLVSWSFVKATSVLKVLYQKHGKWYCGLKSPYSVATGDTVARKVYVSRNIQNPKGVVMAVKSLSSTPKCDVTFHITSMNLKEENPPKTWKM